MSHKIATTASIEDSLYLPESSETDPSSTEYFSNLKVECHFFQRALKTAEGLIANYRLQNQALKQDNEELRLLLTQRQQYKVVLQERESQISDLQREMLKDSVRIGQLLERNMRLEQQVSALERTVLRLQRESESRQSWNRVQEQSREKERERKQRKEAERLFKGYLKLANKSDSFQLSRRTNANTAEKSSFYAGISRKTADHSDNANTALQWKLKQKDTQILVLIKQLRATEILLQESRIKDRRLVNSEFSDDSSVRNHDTSRFCG